MSDHRQDFLETEARGRKAFVPAIQGLRGFSALSVMLAHLYLMAAHKDLVPAAVPAGVVWVWDQLGNGVLLFFMISGYLIPASLARHRDVGKFLVDRALRILPVYVVLHAIVFAIGPGIGYKWMSGLPLGTYVGYFLANLLFLAPLLDVPLAQQNSWSLTYEWLFYLVTAAIWLSAARGRRGMLVLLVMAALAAVTVWPITSYFALGMLYAHTGFTLRLPPRVGAVAGIASVAAMYVLSQRDQTWMALIPAAIAFGIVLDRRSALARLLETRAMQFAGRISYSLYLIHPFAIFAALLVATRLEARGLGVEGGFALYAILGLTASVLAAAIGHALLEVRLRLLIERVIRRAPRPGEAGGAVRLAGVA